MKKAEQPKQEAKVEAAEKPVELPPKKPPRSRSRNSTPTRSPRCSTSASGPRSRDRRRPITSRRSAPAGSGSAAVAVRDRRAARAIDAMLESAGRRRSRVQDLCRVPRHVQARRHDHCATRTDRRHGRVRIWARRSPKAARRALLQCQPYTMLTPGALRHVEGHGDQIRSASKCSADPDSHRNIS